MDLKIFSIEGMGDLDKEVVWFDVKEDADLQYYAVCDTTFKHGDQISNELRNIHWFAPRLVKKGDYVALFTKDGTDTKRTNKRQTTSHILYWKIGKTVWNKNGDSAVLFQLNCWDVKTALPEKS